MRRAGNIVGVRRLNAKTSASTNIRSINYNQDKQLLEIRFHSGATYLYRGVPDDIYRQLAETVAKDEYVARNIKPKYYCSKTLTV